MWEHEDNEQVLGGQNKIIFMTESSTLAQISVYMVEKYTRDDLGSQSLRKNGCRSHYI